MGHYKMHVAVYLVLRRGEEMLLHLRKGSGHFNGYYSLLAGHADGGEPATLAMVREAKEEAGIDIDPADLKVVHTAHSLTDREYMNLFMECSQWKGDVRNCEPEKCADLTFFRRGAMPKNLVPFVGEILGHIDDGISYSEKGF